MWRLFCKRKEFKNNNVKALFLPRSLNDKITGIFLCEWYSENKKLLRVEDKHLWVKIFEKAILK